VAEQPSPLTVDRIRQAWRSAPPRRVRHYGFDPATIKESAAVVPVVETDGEAAVLITKRPETMRFHPGDWVFPGGRVDVDAGESPLDAALRELTEELGVVRTETEVLGQLSTYGPFVTGFLLHVFVAVVSTPLDRLEPHLREVAEVGAFPLSEFLAEERYFLGPIPEGHDPGPTVGTLPGRPRSEATAKFFVLREGEHLWGTQGEIMHDLLASIDATGRRQP
jgi:8-oxo-dGTP pyrophosphatase MutT (NUDIX family)